MDEICVLLATRQQHLADKVLCELTPLNGFRIVGQAADGAQVMSLCREAEPRLMLLDTDLPDISPISLIRTLLLRHPAIRVLGFSMSEDVETIREMIRAGAIGYVLASDPIHELPQALRAALTARSVFSARITQLLLRSH